MTPATKPIVKPGPMSLAQVDAKLAAAAQLIPHLVSIDSVQQVWSEVDRLLDVRLAIMVDGEASEA